MAVFITLSIIICENVSFDRWICTDVLLPILPVSGQQPGLSGEGKVKQLKSYGGGAGKRPAASAVVHKVGEAVCACGNGQLSNHSCQ